MAIQVAKADGVREPFDPGKLRGSLSRAGAAPEAAESIAKDIEGKLYDGIPTHEIYAAAFKELRDHRRHAAARYSLKRAVVEFGPSGFPFEQYLGKLFKAEGFLDIAVDQIIQGACVEHEVDVVYRDGDKHFYTEAKFHNTLGFKTDLKTVLYVKARIDDIRDAANAKGAKGETCGLVVTNTKFTSMAIAYASCKGLELLSWDYPEQHTLHERIEQMKLYPVTALTSLSQHEKTALLSQKIVLCKDVLDDTRALAAAGIQGARAEKVLAEAGALCIPEGKI